MNIKKFILFFSVLTAILIVNQYQQNRLWEIREEHDMISKHQVASKDPMVAFTTGALGAFRGLFADLLFLRMQAEQEAGNYFEILQLGEMISQLQPDMPGAITFLAWNMSYNISVTFSSHEDRWRWVQRGLELIRDEALKYNKEDPEIYHQLGWIYQHKVGQILDDANRYYKGQLALQYIEVLGDKPRYDWASLAQVPTTEDGLRIELSKLHLLATLDDTQNKGVAINTQVQNLIAFYNTQQRMPTFIEQTQNDAFIQKLSEEVAKIGKQKASASEKELNRLYLSLASQTPLYLSINHQGYRLDKVNQDFRNYSGKMPAYVSGLSEVESLALENYLRVRWLSEVYKIEAKLFYELIKEYTYLDIRLPEAHSMYWARQGLKIAPDHANLQRMMLQGMSQMAKAGRLRFVTPEGYAVVMPSFEVMDFYVNNFIEEKEELQSQTSFRSGFENFVKDSIVSLWSWGQNEQAERYMKMMREADFIRGKGIYKQSLSMFCLKEASQDIADQSDRQVTTMLMGFGTQYIRALAFEDNQEQEENLMFLITRIRERYNETVKDSESRYANRRKLPDVEDILASAKLYLIQTESLPSLRQRYQQVGPDLETFLKKIQENQQKIQRN